MTKAEIMKIAEAHNMDFIRENAVGRNYIGVWCYSNDLIPELDAIVEENKLPVTGERSLVGDEYLYRIFFPSTWTDVWGWKD